MVSLHKLLVVTPANSIQPSVISQSIKLAKNHQSHVTFFSVAEEIPKEQLALITLLPPQEVMENLVKEQHVVLQKSIEQFNHNYDSVDAKNVIGVPFIEVTKKVQQEDYDLVVLAAKTSDRPRKRFFGSTTIHLMRKCPCPVLTIGTKEDKPIKRIVAAIDVYAPSEEGLALNNKILTWAANLAAAEKAELHVIHAWELPGEAYLKGWGHNSEVDRLEMIMKEQLDRQKLFDKTLKNNFSSDNFPNTKLIEGTAQEEIPKYIEEQEIDLVVMGTVCRTGITGLFIGNTAESILSEVSCSVLTLKPEGFETPVK
ncbi:MAG: universal stress protein E [Alteromonadaceae bacterium]|jgi:universal stress protein E